MPYKDPEKQRLAQRKHYEQNIDRYNTQLEQKRAQIRGAVYTYKESHPCVDCNGYHPYYMMEFDHLDGHVKVDTVSRLVRTSTLEKVMDEIVKCELVCSNCHKQRTWFRSKLKQMYTQVNKHMEEKVSKNSAKRKDKRIEHATYVWEREQIQAAAAQSQLDKAVETIERHKADLTEAQKKEVDDQAASQRQAIKDFLLKAKQKYENKLAELQ
jgi:hypothetical protein